MHQEQHHWMKVQAHHSNRHRKDMQTLNSWAEDGFDEGLRPMECNMMEYVEHDNDDLKYPV